MKIIVNYSRSRGEVVIPASKSDLHRAIFAACLANGTSVIKNITLSNDINATIDAFKALANVCYLFGHVYRYEMRKNNGKHKRDN